MGRNQRYFPDGSTVEVMARTHRATRLLRPSAETNALFVGVIGEALRRYGRWIQVHELNALSTHYHGALTLACQAAFEAYMHFVQGQLAVKIGWETRWHATLWGQRYSAGVVFESAMARRRAYIQAQGLPEGLFASPLDSPCVSSVRAVARGEFELRGVWVGQGALKRAGPGWSALAERGLIGSPRVVPLHPWPIDRGKSRAVRQAEARAAVARLAAEAAAARTGSVLGAAAMRAADPHSRTADPPRGRSCPLAFGTKAEVAGFKAEYAAEIERRDRLMDDLVGHLDAGAWPEGLAMHSVLRVALRRRGAQAAAVRQALRAAGLEDLAAAAEAGWPSMPVRPVPVAPVVVPVQRWTRRMVRRQRARGARLRLRARRRGRRAVARGRLRRRGLRLRRRPVAAARQTQAVRVVQVVGVRVVVRVVSRVAGLRPGRGGDRGAGDNGEDGEHA